MSTSFFNNFNLEEDAYYNNDNYEAIEPKVDIKLEADDHEEYEDIPQEDNNTSIQQGLTS